MNESIQLPKGLTYTKNHTLGDLMLVIDLQNVYQAGQPWACRDVPGATKQIVRLCKDKVPDNIIFTRFIAPANPIGTWHNYNETYAEINANPWMNELLDDVLPFTNTYPVFDKSTYSSYLKKEVANLCSLADRVIITGVVAECCVLATIYSAVDAGDRVIYLKDAVTGLSTESEALTQTIVSNFSPIHTTIMTVDEYCESRKNKE